MNPFISIVIPALNLASSMPLLLRCLESQEFPADQFEIIIVDDGSTDTTVDVVRSFKTSLNLTVISHQVNQGRSGARNTGWKHARGEVVIFLDGDMLPAPGWLKDYDHALRAHPELDVISGGRYCVNVGGSSDVNHNLARLVGSQLSDLFLGDVPAQFAKMHAKAVLGQYPAPLFNKLELQFREVCALRPESLLCAYSLVTSNVAIRKQWLDLSGGFDPFLRRAEDSELGFRLWESGARFGFADGARAYHLYDARQPDRNMTPSENLAFFYRHPYSLVLMVHLWCAANFSGAAKSNPLFAGSLAELDQKGRGPLSEDLQKQVAALFPQLNVASCEYSREFLVDYFSQTFGSPAVEVEDCLNSALEQGIFAVERNGKVFFDIYHTSNWLRNQTTHEEYCLLFSSYGRTHKTQYQHSRDPEDLAVVNYSGIYEVTIPQEMFENQAEATLNLPLPVEHACQTGVRISSFFPEDLSQYVDRARGSIVGFPLSRCTTGKISYAFQCRVLEGTAAKGGATDYPDILQRFLQPTLLGDFLAKARTLLRKINIVPGTSPFDAARAIYSWMLDNTKFYETPFPEPFTLDTGIGSCVHQTSLFINLCRLLGISARERCGGLLSKFSEEDESAIETCGRGFSLLSHTWAEFYCPSHGWVPVDFVGWGYGERLLTSRNVANKELRAELKRDTAFYDSYYFGNVDPFRIYAGEGVNKLPFYSFGIAQGKKAMGLWQQQLLSRTRHVLRCHTSGSRTAERELATVNPA